MSTPGAPGLPGRGVQEVDTEAHTSGARGRFLVESSARSGSAAEAR